MDDSFALVVDRLRRRFPELLEQDQDSIHIRDLVSLKGPEAEIDYETQALAFNRAYFFKNLYKALVTLSRTELRDQDSVPILDVGAGAGVFSIAWCLYFRQPARPVILVDRSFAQLRIAERMMKVLKIRSYQLLHGNYHALAHPPSLVRLFSYWWCEQHPAMNSHMTRPWRTWLGRSGVIVDYRSVVEVLTKRLQTACKWLGSDTLVAPPAEFIPLIGDPAFAVHYASYDTRGRRY